jgi:hypothetical protein
VQTEPDRREGKHGLEEERDEPVAAHGEEERARAAPIATPTAGPMQHRADHASG